MIFMIQAPSQMLARRLILLILTFIDAQRFVHRKGSFALLISNTCTSFQLVIVIIVHTSINFDSICDTTSTQIWCLICAFTLYLLSFWRLFCALSHQTGRHIGYCRGLFLLGQRTLLSQSSIFDPLSCLLRLVHLVRIQQILALLLANDKHLFPIFNILPLNQVVNHLSVKDHFDCRRIYFILLFAARKHITNSGKILHPLICGLIKFGFPFGALHSEIFEFSFDTLVKIGHILLESLQTVIEARLRMLTNLQPLDKFVLNFKTFSFKLCKGVFAKIVIFLRNFSLKFPVVQNEFPFFDLESFENFFDTLNPPTCVPLNHVNFLRQLVHHCGAWLRTPPNIADHLQTLVTATWSQKFGHHFFFVRQFRLVLLWSRITPNPTRWVCILTQSALCLLWDVIVYTRPKFFFIHLFSVVKTLFARG